MSLGSRMVLIGLTAVAVVAAAYLVIYGAWDSIDDVLLNAPGIDKVLHFLAGGAIWSISHYALSRWTPRWNANARVAVAFAVTAAIVVADEISQSFSSLRTVELLDPLSGLAGSVVAFAAMTGSKWRIRLASAAVASLIAGWAVYRTYERNHDYFEGILLEREAEYETAYSRYRLALEAAPDNAEIYNSLAWLCLEYLHRDYDKALDWALQGIALDPNNSNLLDTLGWAFYKNGQVAPALENVTKAAQLDPDHPIIREHLEVLRAEAEGAPSRP